MYIDIIGKNTHFGALDIRLKRMTREFQEILYDYLLESSWTIHCFVNLSAFARMKNVKVYKKTF